MEDDKIKDLFAGFNPELKDDFSFMTRLKQNMEAVEIVRRHNAELRKRGKKAVIFAAIAGFVTGLLFSFTLPFINEIIADIQMSARPESSLGIICNNYKAIYFILIGTISVFISLNTYDLSLSLLKEKEQQSN